MALTAPPVGGPLHTAWKVMSEAHAEAAHHCAPIPVDVPARPTLTIDTIAVHTKELLGCDEIVVVMMLIVETQIEASRTCLWSGTLVYDPVEIFLLKHHQAHFAIAIVLVEPLLHALNVLQCVHVLTSGDAGPSKQVARFGPMPLLLPMVGPTRLATMPVMLKAEENGARQTQPVVGIAHP